MNLNETLENLRVSYQASRLDAEDCHIDPVIQFDRWLEEAISSKCDEPNAFVLSTVKNNRPRSRVVLLKAVHENDFVFYTNYNSAKGSEVSLNDKVALNFLWLPLQRQIRIEGTVTKVTDQVSDDYFHKRPRGSQIGAIASPQSQKVSDRANLEKYFHDAEVKFNGQEFLPRPAQWGGYMVSPDYIEFWQGRANRMHDRICYEKNNDRWDIYRLAP
jgi:pyridoxamine 5'-phosphate oxidase